MKLHPRNSASLAAVTTVALFGLALVGCDQDKSSLKKPAQEVETPWINRVYPNMKAVKPEYEKIKTNNVIAGYDGLAVRDPYLANAIRLQPDLFKSENKPRLYVHDFTLWAQLGRKAHESSSFEPDGPTFFEMVSNFDSTIAGLNKYSLTDAVTVNQPAYCHRSKNGDFLYLFARGASDVPAGIINDIVSPDFKINAFKVMRNLDENKVIQFVTIHETFHARAFQNMKSYGMEQFDQGNTATNSEFYGMMNVQETAADIFALMIMLRETNSVTDSKQVLLFAEQIKILRAMKPIANVEMAYTLGIERDLRQSDEMKLKSTIHTTSFGVDASLREMRRPGYAESLKKLSPAQIAELAYDIAKKNILSWDEMNYLASPVTPLGQNKDVRIQQLSKWAEQGKGLFYDNPDQAQNALQKAFDSSLNRLIKITGQARAEAKSDMARDNPGVVRALANMKNGNGFLPVSPGN